MTLQEILNKRIKKIRRPEWREGTYIALPDVDSEGNKFIGPWCKVIDESGSIDLGIWELEKEGWEECTNTSG